MCQYVNKFPLSEDIFVRICVKENNEAIDIRRYRGHEATEEGIQLNQPVAIFKIISKTYRFLN